jgi:hypothetical protein
VESVGAQLVVISSGWDRKVNTVSAMGMRSTQSKNGKGQIRMMIVLFCQICVSMIIAAHLLIYTDKIIKIITK